MAKIEVNHQTLRDFASAITDYCDKQDRQMSMTNDKMDRLFSTGYKGDDAQALKGKWAAVNAPESTTVQFRESLKNFSGALDAAAEVYRSAQESVYDQARWLPKYLYW